MLEWEGVGCGGVGVGRQQSGTKAKYLSVVLVMVKVFSQVLIRKNNRDKNTNATIQHQLLSFIAKHM